MFLKEVNLYGSLGGFMKNNAGKKSLLFLGTLFIVALFWACSLNTEATDPESPLSVLPDDSVVIPENTPADE